MKLDLVQEGLLDLLQSRNPTSDNYHNFSPAGKRSRSSKDGCKEKQERERPSTKRRRRVSIAKCGLHQDTTVERALWSTSPAQRGKKYFSLPRYSAEGGTYGDGSARHYLPLHGSDQGLTMMKDVFMLCTVFFTAFGNPP